MKGHGQHREGRLSHQHKKYSEQDYAEAKQHWQQNRSQSDTRSERQQQSGPQSMRPENMGAPYRSNSEQYEQSEQFWDQTDYPERSEFSGRPSADFNQNRNEGQYYRDNQSQHGLRSSNREESSRSESNNYRGQGPKGYSRSDDRIYEEICESLTEHPGVNASDIEVKVTEGEVILTGTVCDRQAKRMAEEAAEEVRGVKDVQNQIRVQGSKEKTTTSTTSTKGQSASKSKNESMHSKTDSKN